MTGAPELLLTPAAFDEIIALHFGTGALSSSVEVQLLNTDKEPLNTPGSPAEIALVGWGGGSGGEGEDEGQENGEQLPQRRQDDPQHREEKPYEPRPLTDPERRKN